MSKKRILIVSKFLYVRGGAEVVALAEADLLRRAGYEVELWGMDYPDNQPVAMADTLASRVVFDGGLADKFRASLRVMGGHGVRRSFAEALRRFRPDTVHFHNIHSYLSPAVVEMAKAAGCRTLWTMHDYKLVCPAYVGMNPDGNACSECIHDSRAVVRRRCMKGSLAQSAAAFAEARIWNIKRLCRATDAFICPSVFMARKLAEGGVPEEKLKVVLHFLDPEKATLMSQCATDAQRNLSDMIYVGRLSEEKGVAIMLRELMSMPDDFHLTLLGGGPLEAHLRKLVEGDDRFEFRGWATAAEVATELSRAGLFICPSLCYENNTTSVMEAMSAGCPVLVSDAGSLPGMLTPISGMAYSPHRPGALADGIRAMRAREWDNAAIRAEALDRFSESRHLNLLEKLL